MATLIFQTQRSRIGSLELDATLSENHQTDNDVTEHPVESGGNIADHVRPKSDVLTLTGFVSDTPVGRPSDVADPDRSASAYEALLKMRSAGQVFTVVTARRVYENMVVKTLGRPHDPGVGRGLQFTVSFTQIRIVTAQTVAIETKVTRAQPKLKGGKKVAEAAPEANVRKSLLKRLADTDTGNAFLTKTGLR